MTKPQARAEREHEVAARERQRLLARREQRGALHRDAALLVEGLGASGAAGRAVRQGVGCGHRHDEAAAHRAVLLPAGPGSRPAKFHASSSSQSGRSSSERLGSRIGWCVPGMKRPCLCTLRSTTYSTRSVPMPDVVEQRRALRGRAVGGDARAVRPQRGEQRSAARSRSARPARRTRGSSRRSRARRPPPPRGTRRTARAARRRACRCASAACRRGASGKSSTRLRYSPCRAHQRVDRGAREVAEVLVVDRVELAVVDQILDVRVLDRRDAVVREQRSPARRRSRSGRACAP